MNKAARHFTSHRYVLIPLVSRLLGIHSRDLFMCSSRIQEKITRIYFTREESPFRETTAVPTRKSQNYHSGIVTQSRLPNEWLSPTHPASSPAVARWRALDLKTRKITSTRFNQETSRKVSFNFFSPKKLVRLFILKQIKPSLDGKVIKLLTFVNLFTPLRHSRLNSL